MDDDIVAFEPPVGISSPCVLVCTLDPRTGWCLGCGRTGDEIARWSQIDDGERQAIVERLPDRMWQLRRPASS